MGRSSRPIRLDPGRPFPARPRGGRRWRRHGRRAQVAPVATILGLLLVVTYIATYLSTTLPNTMSVNDLNHDVLVENQVAQFATVVARLASVDRVDAQAIFPITLGSQGAPPFAGPDSAQIIPMTNYTGGLYGMWVNYSVTSSAGTRALSAPVHPGAGFVVDLRNTYASPVEVAYDDGAVIYAQPGGTPIVYNPPSIAYSNGELSVVMPVFDNSIGGESGVLTAELSLRMLVDSQITIPVSGYSLASGSAILITVFSPYAAAWLNYFTSLGYSGATITCTPTATSTNGVCSTDYTYATGGAIGKVTMSITGVSELSITQPYFAVSLS